MRLLPHLDQFFPSPRMSLVLKISILKILTSRKSIYLVTKSDSNTFILLSLPKSLANESFSKLPNTDSNSFMLYFSARLSAISNFEGDLKKFLLAEEGYPKDKMGSLGLLMTILQ